MSLGQVIRDLCRSGDTWFLWEVYVHLTCCDWRTANIKRLTIKTGKSIRNRQMNLSPRHHTSKHAPMCSAFPPGSNAREERSHSEWILIHEWFWCSVTLWKWLQGKAGLVSRYLETNKSHYDHTGYDTLKNEDAPRQPRVLWGEKKRNILYGRCHCETTGQLNCSLKPVSYGSI